MNINKTAFSPRERTLQAELHLRSDRTAIANRKWLRQLGLTFGTA